MLAAAILSQGYLMFFVTPEYKSSSKILIEGTSSDTLINNYTEIITSRTVVGEAIEKSNLDNYDSSKIDNVISNTKVKAESNSNLFTISVVANKPEDAKVLNSNITSKFISTASSLKLGSSSAVKLSVFDDADMPEKTENINYLKTDGIMAFAALAVSIVVAFLIYNPEKQLKKEELKKSKMLETVKIEKSQPMATTMQNFVRGQALDLE